MSSNLQDTNAVVGIIVSLIVICGFLLAVGRRIGGWLKPKWEGFLLKRGRVKCPKCQNVFKPTFQNDPAFGLEFTTCPRCKEQIAKEYFEKPLVDEEGYLS